MAIYFDHKLQFPNPGEHLDICWHPSFPLLAVATDHPATRGTVDVFSEEVCMNKNIYIELWISQIQLG